ncbi:hypothetical protein K7X08_038102 [Anisodus acutangulus]|uniref:Uncharacterized protein n=1 Tax=Anisodus acutangulus TaxID=402998 RepID=A0A9Q1N1A9_9SOLA|nr:hypothetical protein K7X08_038102 [Anisodus acutangulus]
MEFSAPANMDSRLMVLSKKDSLGGHRYVATVISSDLLVQIGDVSFHLHKYPLLSRSGKMNRIIYESRNEELSKIALDDLPGGPEAFELAAKFCYVIAVDLTATNISGLRCAAEYLEMTEDLEEGSLIFKTEAFLSYVVLSSWRDSILVLKSCERLSPWAENLQIVRRCSESIAWKVCANPKGIKWQYTGKPPNVSSPKWNEMKDSSPSRNQQVPPDWWFEDVSILRIDHFVRVITAIKVKGMRHELMGAVIMHYAAKWLPGLIKEGSGSLDEEGQRFMSLPSSSFENGKPGESGSCTRNRIGERVGMQFEQATLADLLIPSYNKSETLSWLRLRQNQQELVMMDCTEQLIHILRPIQHSQNMKAAMQGDGLPKTLY